MITLSLLHPIKQIPVQVWTFPSETTIRIGRSTDNQVILYSAVVSRHHVELRRVGANWEIVNLGTNGTYLDGKRITQVPVKDGAIIRLARSGPNIQIRIGEEALKASPKNSESERTLSQGPNYPITSTEVMERNFDDGSVESDSDSEGDTSIPTGIPTGTIPVPPHLQLPVDAVTGIPDSSPTLDDTPIALAIKPSPSHSTAPLSVATACSHPRGGYLFCVDCGQPLQVLQVVENYQILQVLGQGDIGITYQAWRGGQTLALKTLNADWVNNAKAREALECEADMLRGLNHPKIPHVVDFFVAADQPYCVMELMPGRNLAQTVTVQGAVTPEQAIAWVLELCKILDYLHSFTPPILHRGIKPNTLIRQSLPHAPDAIALVDFGAIKTLVLGQEAQIGFTGYTAPEQLAMDATPATDLYALGPLLAYLLTTQNPITFYGDRDQGYRLYADTIPNISPQLADVIQTLTHPQPEQRYPSAKALAEALHKIVNSAE
ncbi:MAG: FHA domain-containing protein [Oculatellaceae cyanobacterium bins.114]|nr:FHA domain-containing protein [Oculatellaceae cyanobacterium bins.114]